MSTEMSSRDQYNAVHFLATRDGWLCRYCGINLIPIDRVEEYCCLADGQWVIKEGYAFTTLEHKTPRCRGGSNDIENLVLACGRCNSRKGKKIESEFLEYLAR